MNRIVWLVAVVTLVSCSGSTGSPGAEGAEGAIGPAGPAGPQGETGAQGPQGETGPQGATGPQGDTGPQGETGLTGPTGRTGATGPQGDTGLQGAPGADGVSVTSVALSSGDENCPHGGSRFTSASGETYACDGAPAPGATYRYAVFDTYDNGGGWLMGGELAMFGGVHPSSWTDGGARAYQLSGDKGVLRTLFTKKGYGGKNAVVHAEVRQQVSSTDGRMVLALFRVRNATASPIGWTPVFWYTAYAGWGEMASVALNGVEAWYSGGGYGTLTGSVALSIPPNRTSTVVFVSGGSTPYSVGYGIYARQIVLAFRNGSLALPAGLSFGDDLDTATGGWEQ
jgi:hypothetical protein